MGYLSEHCIFAPLTQHLRDSLTGFLVAARYVVVDAVNHEKVLQFYARNQFWPVFKTEEDERIANELEPDKPLLIRFMIADLKI